ncbi:GntP family permease [Frisingicoccus caecimuris]|uniref:H+/gluconate symporter-like permease n=1 Tax=Frisingicoccus caecimuris TaxID=1796636 RepID=A0A4R2LAG9_9FIRM|nr:GntP family permease [Frisingicoccus caecimuris]MCR1918341.1 GntP family permease [Frisingicoccus caecimuris]TCO84989.1 H+/gluconate symporter-like permease [Frisingicoccus caecimuris]
MNLGILVLVAALILFGLLAFKQINALILAPLVTIFVIVCSGLPILESLKTAFMPAASDYVTSYFLVFFVGALFGAVYQHTGAAESISKTLAGLCKGKFVAPIIMTITGILTYGGVSGFVVFFVIYPIALNMFKEANLTRRLIPGAISAGCWTWSMYGPGSPSIQNVIGMNSLGTPSTAAIVPSVIATVATYILIFVWLEMRGRSFTKKGITFNDTTLKFQLSPEEMAMDEDKDLPNFWIAMIPIVAILVAFNGFKLPVETAVFLGVALATILMWNRVKGLNAWIAVFNEGAANSGVSILNTAIVVGFGGVVKNTQGFADLVELLKTLNMPALVFVMITVAICAGACGSASGGMGVAFNALTDTYIELGANLEHVHRIATIAAGTLDSLPHQGAQITLLGICKLTHKEAYFDIFVTQIVIPFISCFIFIIFASMGL